MKLRKRPFSICTVLVSLCMLWLYAFLIVCHCEAFRGHVMEPIRVHTAKEKFPIIFLPGVGGTQLLLAGLFGNTTEIWPVVRWRTGVMDSGDWKKIYMNKEGKPLESILPGDILRHTTRWLGSSIYRDILESLQSVVFQDGREPWSYKERENLFVWGYDWRLDNSDHLSALDRRIDEVIKKTKSRKVILIGHSMGGLISRAYAVRNFDKVEKIISIGSPFAGAPKPFYGLVNGYTFGNPFVFDIDMKRLFQNAPSTYQLLPQYGFVTDNIAGSNQIPNEELYNKLKYSDPDTWRFSHRSMNQALVNSAKDFYKIVGTSSRPSPSGVKHFAIIGVGVKTLKGFEMKEADQSNLDYGGKKVVLTPIWGDGDGTVPVESANILDEAAVKYFIHHRQGSNSSGVHGELPNNKRVHDIVGSILLGFPDTADEEVPKPNDNLHDSEPGSDFTLR